MDLVGPVGVDDHPRQGVELVGLPGAGKLLGVDAAEAVDLAVSELADGATETFLVALKAGLLLYFWRCVRGHVSSLTRPSRGTTRFVPASTTRPVNSEIVGTKGTGAVLGCLDF